MPSCNVCNIDTRGSSRIRGACRPCNDIGAFEKLVVCIFCGDGISNSFSMGALRTKKGNLHPVCSDCWEDNTANKDKYSWKLLPKKKCIRCDSPKVLRYARVKSCKACLKKKDLKTCDNCCGEVTSNQIEEKNGKNICKTCISKYNKKCISCDKEYFFEGSGRGGLSIASRVCKSCYDSSTGEILNYTTKPDLSYNPPFIADSESDGVWDRGRKLLYLGVEIEMECNKDNYYPAIAKNVRDIAKNRIFNKSDSTISNGFEMVSHPMILSYHKGAKKDRENNLINPEEHMNWEEVFKYLISKGCLSHNTSTCGLHIHANKSFMTKTDLSKLDIFINSHTREISKLARRSKEKYAKYKKIRKEDFKGENPSSGNRLALHLNNAETVEFRMFKGTLVYSTFISSLQLVDASIRFVKDTAWKDICDLEKSWKLFIAFVDNNDYKELSKYIRLKKVRKAFKEDSSNIGSMIARVNATKLENFEEEAESTCA